MRLMTLCIGLVVLGCAGASGEDTEQEQTGSSEQAVGTTVGHTFEQSLAWLNSTQKVTEVCTLSLLEPPDSVYVYATQIADGATPPNGSTFTPYAGEALLEVPIGRPKERLEITGNCPGAGCRVDVKLFMKGWLPATRLGCEILVQDPEGQQVAYGHSTGSGLHITDPLIFWDRYAYRQKLLMNTQQTRVGHQCMFREDEIPSTNGGVDSFDVLVEDVSVFGSPTTIPIPNGPVVTTDHSVLGMQTSGQGVDLKGRGFNLAKHTIGRDGTIAPGQYVQCKGNLSWDPSEDDFDVNLVNPPIGAGTAIWGAE